MPIANSSAGSDWDYGSLGRNCISFSDNIAIGFSEDETVRCLGNSSFVDDNDLATRDGCKGDNCAVITEAALLVKITVFVIGIVGVITEAALLVEIAVVVIGIVAVSVRVWLVKRPVVML